MESLWENGPHLAWTKDEEESGGNGGQKPLILDCNLSFEKSFLSQSPTCQVLGCSECFYPGVFHHRVDRTVKNSCKSGSDVTLNLLSSPYQGCSLLAGNKKFPEIMIHATWKETVSYVGRDWSNTPYVIIRLATPGSLETILNNTYLNCFHSFGPGGLTPSSHTPHSISARDKWVTRVPLLPTRSEHMIVATAWPCRSSNFPAHSWQLVHPLGLCFSITLQLLSGSDIHSLLFS